MIPKPNPNINVRHNPKLSPNQNHKPNPKLMCNSKSTLTSFITLTNPSSTVIVTLAVGIDPTQLNHDHDFNTNPNNNDKSNPYGNPDPNTNPISNSKPNPTS